MSDSDNEAVQNNKTKSIAKRAARNARYYDKHRAELKLRREQKKTALEEAALKGDAEAARTLERQRVQNRERQKRFRDRRRKEKEGKGASA